MNYFSFYGKNSNLAKVILAITFLSFIVELNAQKKDSIARVYNISEVEIKSSLDVSRYLWNLLKENYSTKIQDTTIFYTIEYKVEVPDSNHFEHFTGVICVEYIDDKSTVFVCEGSFNDSNIINILDFAPINFIIGSFFEKHRIERYGKFKKHKIEHNKMLNSFRKLKNGKKGSLTSVITFNNKLLNSYETISSKSKKILVYEFNNYYSKREYDSLFILKTFNTISKYKFKKVNAIMSLKCERTESTNYIKKQKIVSVTPKSLYDILMEKQ